MKKQILNIGKALSRAEQKEVFGGDYGSDWYNPSEYLNGGNLGDAEVVCGTCANLYIDQSSPRPALTPLGVWCIQNISWMHSENCVN